MILKRLSHLYILRNVHVLSSSRVKSRDRWMTSKPSSEQYFLYGSNTNIGLNLTMFIKVHYSFRNNLYEMFWTKEFTIKLNTLNFQFHNQRWNIARRVEY